MSSLKEILDDFVEMISVGDVAASFRKRLGYIEIEKLVVRQETQDLNELMWHLVIQKWIPLLNASAYNIATIGRTPYYIDQKTFSFQGKQYTERFPVALFPWEYDLHVKRDPDTREKIFEFTMKNVTEQPEIFSIASLGFAGVSMETELPMVISEFGMLHKSWKELKTRRQLADKFRHEMLHPKLYLERTVNTQTQTMDLEVARYQEHLSTRREVDEHGYSSRKFDMSLQSNEKDNTIGLPPNMKFSSFQPRIEATLIDVSHIEERFYSLIDRVFGLPHLDQLSQQGALFQSRSESAIDESRSALVASLASLIREYVHVFNKVWEHMYDKQVEVLIPHQTHLDTKTITLLTDVGVIDKEMAREKLMRMHGITEPERKRTRVGSDKKSREEKEEKEEEE